MGELCKSELMTSACSTEVRLKLLNPQPTNLVVLCTTVSFSIHNQASLSKILQAYFRGEDRGRFASEGPCSNIQQIKGISVFTPTND